MSFFTKKNFLYKLIVCLCIFLALISVVKPQKVYAESEDSGVGGVLINPICRLLAAIGDAIMGIIQKSIMGTDATIPLDNTDQTWLEKNWKKILAVVAIIAICVVISFIPGGWAAIGSILASVGKFIAVKGVPYLIRWGATCLVIGTTAGAVVATTVARYSGLCTKR